MLRQEQLGNAVALLSSLPPVVRIERKYEADFYGASSHIASALSFKSVPASLASWTHGPPTWWMELKYPQQVAFHRSPLDRSLVVTKEHERFLRRRGYLRTYAVGAPILYVPEISARRQPGSLLVMPGHTLSNADHQTPFDAYVQFIAGLRSKFDTIVVCIHAADVVKGHWPSRFEKAKIPWVRGADSSDKNALARMVSLLKQFEFVTTNALGSHIPYAAHFGCKVSICGPRSQVRETDMADVLLYKQNPALLRYTILATERFFETNRSPFLVHPTKARENSRFGAETLGLDARKSPQEIADLLGWNLGGRTELLLRDTLRFATRLPRRAWKTLARGAL